MDVLLLFEYPTLCGGEQSLLCLLPSIRAAGWRVRAAAPPVGLLAEALRALDVEVLPLALRDPSGARRPLETCREELAALLSRARPGLLHANSLSMTRLSGPVAAARNVPSLGHIRDIVGLSRRAVADVNRHAALLAVSRAARDFHIAQGIDPSRIHVLYNAVDASQFYPRLPSGYLNRELGLPRGARLLAAIGQIGPRKGLDAALRAMQRIVARRAGVHLLVVGERLSTKAESIEFELALRSMAAAGPLAGHVHFLGWRTDVAALLPELALLVHAARQEPLGRVLLEAAACGCPVVATRVGGTAEIFQPAADGANLPDDGAILVAPDDADALAEAMTALLNRGDADPGGNFQRRSALAPRFSVACVASQLLDQYQQVAAQEGSIIKVGDIA